MVKIRLKRLGRRKRPFYRIVVMDIRERREGASLAELGYYNPISRELKLDKTAATAWIQKGAQPSEVVAKLIQKAPETGDLIILEKVRKERLSKKAQARVDAEAKAKAEAQAKPAEPAPTPAEAPPAEPVAATEAPTAEPTIAEAPAEEPKAEETAEPVAVVEEPALPTVAEAPEEPAALAEETPAEEPEAEEAPTA